ncbi:phosphatase PAP2 family protein [Bacillus salacetis]|uniref:Phosphatase PAP2 family protein n=1 Tax=Bacillus salacetis TaxID=2315464 RepID=A0A3A1R0Z0_9BACI|nr:phosphatase PAP2 family protein [Bacillus salacetis]RIW35354.1 phosphatase PAP2 family protein [Bacillus salacetis]
MGRREGKGGKSAYGRGSKLSIRSSMVGLIFLLVLSFFIMESMLSANGRRAVYARAVFQSVMTGVSRITAAAHFPSDVLAGLLISFSYYILCEFLYRRISGSAQLKS